MTRTVNAPPVATDRRLPPLRAGERLDQPTFHARYEAMPSGTRAELIGGVVHMPSPVSNHHGQPHDDLATCLGLYRAKTPGIGTSVSGTTILGDDSEPQPDAFMRVQVGGQTRLDAQGYVVGCPELVCEVANSTADYDLRAKRLDYERYGAGEYFALIVPQGRLVWFVRVGDRLVETPPDGDGIYRSRVFPGLWIDAAALLGGNAGRLLDVLIQGLATPEHAAFAAALAGAAATPPSDAGG